MKNNKTKELEGINIYVDKKGQKLYWDPFTKKAYVITKNKEKTFQNLYNIPIYIILVGIFCYILFELSWWISLLAMVITGVFLTYRFYKFLNNCTSYNNFKPDQKNLPSSYNSPDSIIYIKIALFTLLAIGLIVSVTVFKASSKEIFFSSIALAIFSITIAFKYLTIIIGRKRI